MNGTRTAGPAASDSERCCPESGALLPPLNPLHKRFGFRWGSREEKADQ